MQPGIRPETELLLRCAAPVKSDAAAARLRALCGQSPDWDFVMGQARDHAVTALLYWSLKVHVPEAVTPELTRSFHENTRNSVGLTAELLRVMDLLTEAGIAVLPVKGPTLAVMAYGNLALRQFYDLDVLVPPGDAWRARSVLAAKGYTCGNRFDAKWERSYLRAYDELGFRGPGGFLIEVHWALTPRYFSVPLEVGPLWSRAVRVPLGNREVPSLAAEDLFLLLCLHANKHCWTRLSMVCDVGWLMTARAIDWEQVIAQARRLGSLRMVRVSVELARRLLEVEVPAAIAALPEDASATRLAAERAARLVEPGMSESALDRILGAGRFHMRARERWRDRWRYFMRLATTAGVEDWEFIELPASMEFLYPLLRFPRLAKKYWFSPRVNVNQNGPSGAE